MLSLVSQVQGSTFVGGSSHLGSTSYLVSPEQDRGPHGGLAHMRGRQNGTSGAAHERGAGLWRSASYVLFRASFFIFLRFYFIQFLLNAGGGETGNSSSKNRGLRQFVYT